MLEKAFHLLTGCVRLEITGDAARFLTVCAKGGIELWGFHREGELHTAWAKPGDYRKLRPLRRRCGVTLRLGKKRGLPFQTVRLKRRKGMAAGVVFGVILYSFLSGFVWGVSVTGSERLTDAEILKAAKSAGVFVGVKKNSFRPRASALKILREEEELSWVSVNTDGCFVEVAVKENEEKPEVLDDHALSNIVASRAGKILAIEAHHGRPEVSPGEVVEEGQLLISGLYPQKVDPYGPQPETPMVTLGAARGKVTAETYREFAVQVSQEVSEERPTGKRQVNRALLLFGWRIPLGFHTVPQGKTRLCREETPLRLLDRELPLALEREEYEFLETETHSLSQEEVKERALLRLREAQRAVLPAGSRIREEELSYSFSQGICILSAKCRCEEEIGCQQPVVVK